jgi:hypothetical protein
MKKLFISMVAVAMGVSAMAASTATADIKLVGSNATYAQSTLSLSEDDARNATYESGYDAESMMSQSNSYSVLIYSYIGTQPCEAIATDDLVNQKISIKTNKVDADYTLQFSNVSGRALKLYDNVTGTLTDITEGGSYAFSVEATQVGRVEVKDRFEIRLAPAGPSICFENNKLIVNGYETAALVIKKDGSAIVSETSLPAAYSKDLSAQTGRLVVVMDWVDNSDPSNPVAKHAEYQIDANPTVEAYTPAP